MNTTFSPVPYEFRETILNEISNQRKGKIFYFNDENMLDSTEGRIETMEERPEYGTFITLENNLAIRIDRIITIFGRPGAAFDEYDSFANQCLDCKGGYDLD